MINHPIRWMLCMFLACLFFYFSLLETYAAVDLYKYDGSGKMVETSYSEGGIINYQYDSNGNLIKRFWNENLLSNGSFENSMGWNIEASSMFIEHGETREGNSALQFSSG
ncbi:RHS repeat protein, partial [Paenibacillus sp. WQ 127069]